MACSNKLAFYSKTAHYHVYTHVMDANQSTHFCISGSIKCNIILDNLIINLHISKYTASY